MKTIYYSILIFALINFNSLIVYTDNRNDVWMLDEHTRITLDAINEWEYFDPLNTKHNWTNNELKFIVLSVNLLTDMWDKGQFLTENLYDGLRLSEIFISISNSVYKNKRCKNSVPDILRQSQDYTVHYNYYIEDTSKNYFNFYPDKNIRDDDGLSRTKGFHFDNLFTFAEIKERWKLINSWVVDMGKAFKKDKGIKKWFVLIGLILHAIQDFYCHSNWVLIAAFEGNNKIIDGKSLPTWEEMFEPDTVWFKNNGKFQKIKFEMRLKDETIPREFEFIGNELSGLQTGNCKNVFIDSENCDVCTCQNFNLITQNGNLAPWGHRHPGKRDDDKKNGKQQIINIQNIFYNGANNDEYLAALELSKRASLYWLNKLLNSNIIGNNKFKKILDTINTKNDVVEDSFTGCDISLNKILIRFDKVYPSK